MATNERGRIVLIFAAVAVAAGAGGYYFIKVYRPKEALAAARADVTAWDTRYAAARGCLLGAVPASSVTSEALAVREMSPDPWDRAACREPVGRLSRDAANSGIDAVESAWNGLDKAAIAAAGAFATHIAASTTLTRDPLPAALDALDAARAQLFAAVEIPVPAAGGKPLPRATVIELSDGGEPLKNADAPQVPSSHGAVTFGSTATHQLQITFVAGATPRIDRVGAGAMRSPTDASWGAVAAADGVRVGEFDHEGVLQAPMQLPFHNPTLVAVGGTHAHGLVVFGDDHGLVVATVAGASVHADPPIQWLRASEAFEGDVLSDHVALDANGDIAMLWRGSDKAMHARTWRAGAMQDVQVPADAQPPMCLTGDRLAVSVPNALFGCTRDASIAYAADRMVAICTPDCQDTALPGDAPKDSLITVVNGKLVTLAAHGSVLELWRYGGSKTFFALPRPAVLLTHRPGFALTDGSSIDVIAEDEHGPMLVRIPASSPAH
jgi:hypothetical protein